jgi:acyl-coenzyme A synthetase/AMP-(fatty) acid ligase
MTPLCLLGLDTDHKAPLLVTRDAELSRPRLLEKAAAFAKELSKQANPSEPMVISLDAGEPFVVSLVGAWIAGCTPVLVDPLVRDELPAIVRAVEARAVVMPPSSWAGDIAGAASLFPKDDLSPCPAVPAWSQDQPVVYLCTSGSTGTPAIVPKSLASLLAEATVLSELFARPSRSATLVPYCHIYGFLHALLVPTFTGGTSDLSAGISPRALLELASQGTIQVGVTVPAVLKAMIRSLEEGIAPSPRAGTRFVTAGAALPSATRARFEELSGCSITDIYGSTEAGTIATRLDNGPWIPAPAVETRITDDGILEVRSPFAALPGPDGFQRTGDLARRQESGFVLEGRGDDIVKIGSRRTSLSEIERVLAQHPQVVSAGVVPAILRGETRLVAFVQTATGLIDEAELKHFVRDKLADHKVPRRVIGMDEMPVRAGGKPDRRQLERLLARYGIGS